MMLGARGEPSRASRAITSMANGTWSGPRPIASARRQATQTASSWWSTGVVEVEELYGQGRPVRRNGGGAG